MERCEKCGKILGEYFKTAYGEKRCANCYDDYLMTDKGKVEYLIGIVKGDFPMEHYDADFLGWVAACWKKYRDELPMSNKVLAEIEVQAAYLGLL
jgi:phage FluMu protein Com